MQAPAICCTTFCESTSPDRRHVSTTVKNSVQYRAYIWTKTRIFKWFCSDNVYFQSSICGVFVLQYSGCYGSNPHKVVFLGVKPPYAFHGFQTPSCLSPVCRPNCMQAPAIGCTTFCDSTSPDHRLCVYHCKIQGTIQGIYMDQNTHFKWYCSDNVCVFKQHLWCVCATIFRLLRL